MAIFNGAYFCRVGDDILSFQSMFRLRIPAHGDCQRAELALVPIPRMELVSDTNGVRGSGKTPKWTEAHPFVPVGVAPKRTIDRLTIAHRESQFASPCQEQFSDRVAVEVIYLMVRYTSCDNKVSL
jgi:hypothetical protein